MKFDYSKENDGESFDNLDFLIYKDGKMKI